MFPKAARPAAPCATYCYHAFPALRVVYTKRCGQQSNQTTNIPEAAMYGKFTDRAREAMRLAAREAKNLKHGRIVHGHILLGLSLEGTGVAAIVMKDLGIEAKNVSAELENLIKHKVKMHFFRRLLLDDATKVSVSQSRHHAMMFGCDFVGTEHLLLAILSEQSTASLILHNLGISAESLQKETHEMLRAIDQWDGPNSF